MSTPDANAGEATALRPGEQLRAAREQRGLTPPQAAQEMRIDLATLRALESDDYARLGAPIFVKGHLRNYAKHLGLAADPLIAAYEQIAAPKPPSLVGYRNEGEQVGGHIELKRWLPVVAGGIATVLLVLFAWWLFHRPAAPPMVAAEGVVEPASTAASTATPVAPAAAPGTTSDGPPAATAATVAAATTGDAPRAEAPTEPSRASAPGQMRLALRFSGESWVEVTDAAGQPLVYQLFEAGQARELDVTPPLRVFLGQAASVTLTLDGRKVDLAPLTKRDATARLTIAAGGSVR